ncbi:hypothetical protein MNKW57_24010 [Biformimicrobium ophioploci]|uniref:Hydrazine synthase alpha subunit middle domain-containing protein n=1 Tax=Biformimicrobium ophioploci TaxID=3036711 RepID=A0ABQ6M155_9GAMM|nr:hypothetical protein MNKW57_24010 [Microbulbifer sp. NKW57]
MFFAGFLTACSGGSGSDSSISGDQKADPVVVDYPIVFVRRPLPLDEEGMLATDDVLAPQEFRPGASLILKDRASGDAPETVLTEGLFEGDIDIQHLNVSPDGEKLIFSLREPEIPGADEDEQPTWDIWEYALESGDLRRIIATDISAEAGQDLYPAYLPDGRIIFSSTRQRRGRAQLLDDNKPQYSGLEEDLDNEAFTLHVMDEDGSNIKQVTFNQSHDLAPAVMPDGRILFSRWDNMGRSDSVSLYTTTPDGRNIQPYYGYHSQATGSDNSAALHARPWMLENGQTLVILRARESNRFGGDLVIVDGENFTEAYSEPNQSGTLVGQNTVSVFEVLTNSELSPHGHFASAYPLRDGSGRLLVSWSDCRIIDQSTMLPQPCTDENLAQPDPVPADPLYGLWIYDYSDGTQRPVVVAEEGIMISEAVALEPSFTTGFIADPIAGADLEQTLVDENAGILDIRSVYDIDGTDIVEGGIAAIADPVLATAEDRPARFLRIVKAVPIPDENVREFNPSAFGVNRSQLMREIVGYTPIQPDGSVRVRIPANIPFAISVVDRDGRRIFGPHQNWLQLRPGEIRSCTGCHERGSEVPHGRADKEPQSAWPGASTSDLAFPNTEPALKAQMGETMAQLLSRIAGEASLSGDLGFIDVWTDPLVRPKDPSWDIFYRDLTTAIPAAPGCETTWQDRCKAIIHYPTHIQPIWELPRPVFDANDMLIADHTCTGCHTNRDANSMTQVPAGQLELTAGQSDVNPDWMTAYAELLLEDGQQELVDGALRDLTRQATDDDGNPLFQLDGNGDPLLDINGDPIPLLEPVPQGASMRAGAAVASRFFEKFEAGGSHAGYLTAEELKLISEWLDIGAQYYNNPFEAPVN